MSINDNDAMERRSDSEVERLRARVADLEASEVGWSSTVRELRQKLAIAGVEGSPPPGEDTTIGMLQARVAKLEREKKTAYGVADGHLRDWRESQAEVARLRESEAGLRARRFPVLGAGFSIPWACVAPFDAQAQANHDQSLERLAARGGLAPLELWCVMYGKKWRERGSMTDAQALEWARGLTYWIAPLSERERALVAAARAVRENAPMGEGERRVRQLDAALAAYAEVPRD